MVTLFDLILKVLSEDRIEKANSKMHTKFGTDGYVDMMHEGADKPFSKFWREFVKALF